MVKRKWKKRPPAEIARLNKTLPRLELATALEMTGGIDEMALGKLLRSQGESAGKNISTLAAQLGLPYKRVVECYRDMKRLEGVVAVAQRLPKVMEDVAIDAESKELTCSSCEGLGQITAVAAKPAAEGKPAVESVLKKCLPCEGKGLVVKPGDAVARKQVLEMMELTGKAPIWAPGSQILALNESLEDTMRNARKGGQDATNRMERTIDGDEQGAGAYRNGVGARSS